MLVDEVRALASGEFSEQYLVCHVLQPERNRQCMHPHQRRGPLLFAVAALHGLTNFVAIQRVLRGPGDSLGIVQYAIV